MQEVEGKIEERVYRLEAVLEEFIRSVGVEFNKLYNSQMHTEASLGNLKKRWKKIGKLLRKD
uniref:Uncharacterized protein n=1 Tax=Thermodesulfobacterium geofontis TaxID=1295609 RepID=A0A7C4NTR1_9BACT